MKKILAIIIGVNLFLILNIFNYQQANIKIKEIQSKALILNKSENPIKISICLDDKKLKDKAFIVDLANRYNVVLNIVNKDSAADFYVDHVKEFHKDKTIIGGAVYSTKYDKTNYLISSSKEDITDYEKITILKVLTAYNIYYIENNKFLEILADEKINLDTVKYKSNVFEKIHKEDFFEQREKTISLLAIFFFGLASGLFLFVNFFVLFFENSMKSNFQELIREDMIAPYIIFNICIIFLAFLATYII